MPSILEARRNPNWPVVGLNSEEVGDTTINIDGKVMVWITNMPKAHTMNSETIASFTEKGLVVTRPCATIAHSVRELEDMGMVGVYGEA